MIKKIPFCILACVLFVRADAQTKKASDSLPDYDALFNELAHFIDSLTAPWSFATINVSAGFGHFQYPTTRDRIIEKRHLILSPAAGYYHKSGLGISGIASVLEENKNFTWYQTAATASYDYLQNRKLLTGISFTHFFTKDSLPFYVSPLNNEVNAYFTYRGWWLKPAVAAGYGWGSTTSVEKQKVKIHKTKKKVVNGVVITETTESINDLSITASVKHDFYWLKLLSKRDYVRVTPQVIVTSGTQKYGLEQINSAYISEKRNSTATLFDTEKNVLSAQSHFQLLALSGRLRAEYVKGIFFIQPQLLFDYYVPEKENKTATAFVLNAGILF